MELLTAASLPTVPDCRLPPTTLSTELRAGQGLLRAPRKQGGGDSCGGGGQVADDSWEKLCGTCTDAPQKQKPELSSGGLARAQTAKSLVTGSGAGPGHTKGHLETTGEPGQGGGDDPETWAQTPCKWTGTAHLQWDGTVNPRLPHGRQTLLVTTGRAPGQSTPMEDPQEPQRGV